MKPAIFLFLLISSVFYTLLVYTKGTECAEEKLLNKEAAEGKLVFQQYNCQSCHQIYGLGGYMGPDLTNVISSPGKGEIYARAIMQTGTNKMPNFHLSKKELGNLTAYLKAVDKTGTWPICKPTFSLTGNITLR
jgi:nitric oxide reductase subunit C